MRPDDNIDPNTNKPARVPGAAFGSNTRPQAPTPGNNQAAVANLARNELDNIYSNDPNHTMPAQSQPENPTPDQTPATSVTDQHTERELPKITRDFQLDPAYARTHSDDSLTVSADSWKQYHSAWQSYYQQYFHRYYAGHLMQTSSELEKANQKVSELEAHAHELTPEQAAEELKGDIRTKVSLSARKIRKSRHFVPIASALAVMLIFLFLQYNTILTGYAAAYIMPGAVSPSNIIVDPNESDVVSDDPRLIIPKIAVDVPVVYDDTMGSSSAETAAKQDLALEKGVAWFGVPGANSHPGQLGNTVLSGHSSNDWLAPGDYKFVFARLDQLKKGDVIYANYKGTRYTYTVTNKKVINPSDVSALYIGDDKPMLTLLTCTPVGTALNRLLVYAEQVSPNPSAASKSPAKTSTGATTTIPGNSPSALQRLFGG